MPHTQEVPPLVPMAWGELRPQAGVSLGSSHEHSVPIPSVPFLVGVSAALTLVVNRAHVTVPAGHLGDSRRSCWDGSGAIGPAQDRHHGSSEPACPAPSCRRKQLK